MPGIGAHDPPEYARDAHTEDFKQYDLDKQLRIYQCGLHREPPDIMLSSYIAKRGESAIPELLKKLENTTDDETKYEIIEVFSSMATWDTCETTQSAYYSDGKAAGLPNAVALKKLLTQWKTALTENRGRKCVLFFPFNLQDEWVECFKATLSGETISLTDALVAENGWAVPVENLRSFIVSAHEILNESDELFDLLSAQEFIEALSAAQVLPQHT